ncbi:MAG: tetratricopeptide repeat protein [Spirulina sp. SIO3F2]|nr:tetratricopeptide repeat protein [Spirulina sp. SIO3F2]
MPKRNWLLSLLAIAGTWQGLALPATSQALLPYNLELDNPTLETQGLILLQDAVQLLRFEQYDLALPRVKLATQLAPQEFRTWFLLGSLYVQDEKVAEGIEVLERALNLIPVEAADDRPSLLFMLGSAYFQNEQYLEARQAFTEGLEAEDSAEAWFDLGNTDYQLRNYREAITAYRQAIDLEAKFWPAINNIGLVQYEQGQLEAAVKQWEKALEVDEEAAEPLLAIAVARYRQGQVPEALEIAHKALRLDPSYGDLDFLKLNLWGDRLLTDTSNFFGLPEMQELLAP